MRLPLGLLVASLVAAVGALLLGEYQLDGWVAVAAGGLLGLLAGEAAVAAAGTGSIALVAGVGGAAGSGYLWAGWISTSHDLGRLEPEAWVAALVAVALGAVIARPHRRSGTPAEPAPPL